MNHKVQVQQQIPRSKVCHYSVNTLQPNAFPPRTAALQQSAGANVMIKVKIKQKQQSACADVMIKVKIKKKQEN